MIRNVFVTKEHHSVRCLPVCDHRCECYLTCSRPHHRRFPRKSERGPGLLQERPQARSREGNEVGLQMDEGCINHCYNYILTDYSRTSSGVITSVGILTVVGVINPLLEEPLNNVKLLGRCQVRRLFRSHRSMSSPPLYHSTESRPQTHYYLFPPLPSQASSTAS